MFLQRALSLFRNILWLFRPGGLRRQVSALAGQVEALQVESRHLQESFKKIEAGLEGLSEELRRRQWLEHKDLRGFEKKVFSQNGEDGIIEEIFRRIGVQSKFFVEFGAENGLEGNCLNLAKNESWAGLYIEADKTKFSSLKKNLAGFPKVQCVSSLVTVDNIEELLAENQVPFDFDLLSIDIDGNDYWVWKSVFKWKPRVVAIEYNASHSPSKKWIMSRNDSYSWNGTSYFGASLAALEQLGRDKSYTLVATDTKGVNAFFVRDDLFSREKFLNTAVMYHYSPPRFGTFEGGHPPGSGPWCEE
jgi:hypothetical protein